ncbi:MAG: Jag N-terminal domain-containing protein [Clostridia bacterium]|nr:Jag N-terminal domain-containing protein [Clostridia bacterium]
MIKEITAVGKDLLEAKENARAGLGAGELDDVQFEILDGGTKGILGLFARPAKVKAFIELPDPVERRQKKDRGEKKQRNENNGANVNNKRKNKPERKMPEASGTEAESKPRSEVIPEAQLKMERREVAEGEDMSYDFIKTLLSDIGLNADAELYACEDGTRRITIVGEDASTLIGHHGDTLDAVQYLANLASARKNAAGERDKSRVTIDIEGYRAKREETLRALARRMAAKALRNKRSVMLEPMNAYERRIIHSEIQSIEGVSTNSIGSDNNRKIVIFLTDKKPKEIFEEETENETEVVTEPVAVEAAAEEATNEEAPAEE